VQYFAVCRDSCAASSVDVSVPVSSTFFNCCGLPLFLSLDCFYEVVYFLAVFVLFEPGSVFFVDVLIIIIIIIITLTISNAS